MRRLLTYLRPYKAHVAGAVLLLTAGSALAIVGPWLTQQAIDEAIPNGDAEQLVVLTLAYLGALLGSFALLYAQGLLTTWLGQSVMFDLRREIFRKFQALDLRYFDRNPVGRLMTRITSDVETLNELFASGLVTVFGDVFTLVFIVGAMFLLDVELALVTLSVLPFVGWAVFLFRGRIRDAYRDIRVRVARINAYIHERITGVRVLQLFNREVADQQRHDDLTEELLEGHLRSITYYALFFPVIQLFTAIALALIIWWGGRSILEGAVTVGVVTAFLQYAQRFFRPIQDLSEKYNLLQGAMASSERVFKLLDYRPAVVDPDSPRSMPEPAMGRIEFDGVHFAYGRVEAEGRLEDTGLDGRVDRSTSDAASQAADGASAPAGLRPEGTGGSSDTEPDWDWILHGISFTVEPGEKIAIVGHTGAGKSTIINLLMRFYDPQRGEVRVDGVPVRDVTRHDLRARIGLVLQDVFLFSEDISYNIRLGEESIPDEALRHAADEIGATPFIDRLEQGYDQPLGERGASLSVGERQLISFARALVFDPPILVLDEATSSVDSEIEAKIEAATDRLMQGRTSIVIAHRLSTVQNADRILVMDRGRICEQGTHAELLEAGGHYARLHELQFAGVGG